MSNEVKEAMENMKDIKQLQRSLDTWIHRACGSHCYPADLRDFLIHLHKRVEALEKQCYAFATQKQDKSEALTDLIMTNLRRGK
jgi:chaperonin cofactor prefoldin